ncbi:hypothetical protein [Helicobacter bilis]|uniref:hypothetical protein n=1 Tax=Helicobacter bilis TaxID=37372 RepID=UPI002557E5E9|nr:hypothetical protein [Helicobacter bilis]
MAKKETQQRVLVIKNFKNIGVSKMDTDYNLSDKLEELVLNTSYTGDHHGGLITIIGENNIGKTGKISALAKFMFWYIKAFTENDFPNFSNYEACEPSLRFVLRDYTHAAATAANNGGGGKICLSYFSDNTATRWRDKI